ncbi:MAG: NADH-quinone oxidoreductase subunit C [Peptococcaceae bacterium]|jgi:NADH-quinone oxidoreductase subunit C|nr:NADH-quinone oxidoreductase subunit C [Peptococcaceae bacterium]
MLDEKVAGRLPVLGESMPSLEVKENAVTVGRDELPALLRALKEDPELAFNYLTNLTATDLGDRITVVYHLVSFIYGYQLTVGCDIPRDDPRIPSVMEIYRGADWQERETYDLLGVIFEGRDLARILLHDGFEGYPLRKDFTWAGGRD